MSELGDKLCRVLTAREGHFSDPCPACDRDKPCMPPAPTCPHSWYALGRAAENERDS